MQDKKSTIYALTDPVEVSNEVFILPEYSENGKNEALLYKGIITSPNKWIDLACDLASESVKTGGGPFGAVLIQVDSPSGLVIRYWATSNGVTKRNDPTAHAEVLAIRSACDSLGVFHLDMIHKPASRLDQPGMYSHGILFSSCEPCPMCYGAISWAKIPCLFFGASRYDAAANMVGFSDAEIYNEIEKPYAARKIKSFKCNGYKTTEAFYLWKKTPGIHY